MDTKDKNVYVINGEGYPLEKVIKEIEEELYPYNFHFDRDVNTIQNADEVWVFGNCECERDYKLAHAIGKSIWIMG